MLSKWLRSITGAAIYVLAWHFAWVVVLLVFSYSPSRYAYATISAWWCALYVGYVLEIRIISAIPVAIIFMLIIGIVEIVFELDWFYHDPPAEISMIVFRYLIFSSPIFINSAVRTVIGRRRRSEDIG